MSRRFEPRTVFATTNPNKAWVAKELSSLLSQWKDWLTFTESLEDSPDYNPNTSTEALKDGRDNRRKHEILREKTLVFIGNNFVGYDFLFQNWPSHPHEDNTARLFKIIPGWVHRLETLIACLDYAVVPDGYWKAKGKQLADKVIEVGADKGADIAASWLKNPLG
jgi:hypothetical protein